MNRLAPIILATLALPYATMAQAQPMTPPQRAQGTVTALTATSMTLARPNGKAHNIALLPDRRVNIVAPIALDQIVPGSYVATANKTQADGSGVSTELRVYPPGPGQMDVNTAMNASGNLMMTNGTVATAVSSVQGRELTVDYGKGTRKITVPKSIQAVSNTPGSLDLVKVGRKLSVVTFPARGGRPAMQIITIARKELGSAGQ